MTSAYDRRGDHYIEERMDLARVAGDVARDVFYDREPSGWLNQALRRGEVYRTAHVVYAWGAGKVEHAIRYYVRLPGDRDPSRFERRGWEQPSNAQVVLGEDHVSDGYIVSRFCNAGATCELVREAVAA